MTVVIGAVDEATGVVTVMGDSAASTPGTIWTQKDLKVWRAGELALGFCGSFRGRDLLQSSLEVPPAPAVDVDPQTWLRTLFVDAVRKTFREGGFVTTFREGHEQNLSTLLIGMRGRLFVMRNDFSIGEESGTFTAVGSGAPEAYGSLYSTRSWPDVQQRLTDAMNASATYNGGTVRGPYYYVQTDPWPTK